MQIVKKNSFENLIDNVYQVHCLLQENAAKAVNFNLTVRNWLVGWYIIEYEQNGEDRAQYGKRLIDEMAKRLKDKGIKGLAPTPLRLCRTFYLTYRQIQPTISVELQRMGYEYNTLFLKKGQSIQPTASVELQTRNELPIREIVSAELQPESSGNYPITSELLLTRLSFSHFIELIRVEDDLQRLFYEVESIKNNWSVKELGRAINTSLALRTTLSTNKEAVIAKIKNLKPTTNAEVIRNPVILEFLDLQEKAEYSETDLEQQILNHLKEFLLELGTGFCFEARQKRITFNNKHYRIDLVFYHRILKCHVLFDLKINEFDHSDAGQMNVYLNYYRKNEMSEGDNLPVGIILCADKDNDLVEFATSGMDDQMFVSKYLLKLPDKKLLESFIKRELNK
ncbi:MAG: PDDEXK nuclease domain-containing protein [Tannerella sp.]|jgi:predicted nuclease of restriction endonuclease-like (RecB) superfamily|nr:PDDEXK nuclease domain-containing protein [Tannerella sp.]